MLKSERGTLNYITPASRIFHYILTFKNWLFFILTEYFVPLSTYLPNVIHSAFECASKCITQNS